MVGEQGKLQEGIWKSEMASLMGYQKLKRSLSYLLLTLWSLDQ